MNKKTENTKSASENIKAELANLGKLYKTRKAALEKMSKFILEDEITKTKGHSTTVKPKK